MESKKLPARVIVPAEIEELSRQIEQWRITRLHGAPMPAPLWTLAANLAKRYGVARIARFLHLDYYSLKERIQAPARHEVTGPESGPTFVELPHLSAAPVSECSIELEHPRGARMRIQVKGVVLPDLAALTRTFWGVKR